MRRIAQTELDALLEQHARWLATPQGEPMTLRDVDASGLSLAGRRLVLMRLINVKLDGADLQRALLANATLEQVSLVEANLTEADFESAYGKQLDARRAVFTDASLSSVSFHHCNFMQARMERANLIKATFISGIFDDAVLTDTRCNRITIAQSSLRQVQLQNAYMSFVWIYDSDLRGSNLSGVQLIKAKSFRNLAVAGLIAEGLTLEEGRFEGWYDASSTGDQSELHDGAWIQRVLRGEIKA
jgi:uncharacterized protein YjbI with pentapeptide repeats